MITMAEEKPAEVYQLLTPEQVAKQLNTSERIVGNLLRSRELVGIKVGREWRVHPLDLEAFIQRNKREK